MKKIFSVLVLCILVIIYSTSVNATEPTEPGIFVVISNPDLVEFTGHIDMLVKASHFEGHISSTLKSDFTSRYPNYETFDYLNDSEWISYCGFILDSNCFIEEDLSITHFATEHDEYLDIDAVKFICVDQEGNTISLSEMFKIPRPLSFQDPVLLNSYNIKTQEFTSHMGTQLELFYFFVIPMVFMVSIFFAIIRTVLLNVLKIPIKRLGMTFIYYIIVYNVLFILGFYIANEVRFVGNSIIYSWY